MNKEQQELLDEAYRNYLKDFDNLDPMELLASGSIMIGANEPFIPFTQEEFINKCKWDGGFANRWGLKIEERELTYSERYKMWFSNNYETGMEYCEENVPDFNDEYYEPTPTKLITVTYNDKTIEGYE